MSFTSLYWKQEVNGPHRSPEQYYVWLNQLYEVISKIYRQWVKWNFRRWAKNWLFSFNVKIVKHITEYPHNVRSPVSCSGFVTLTGPLMLRRFPVRYRKYLTAISNFVEGKRLIHAFVKKFHTRICYYQYKLVLFCP